MSTDDADPTLWGDPLWTALERAIRSLDDNPAIIHEKKPEWSRGLNITELNRLARELRMGRGRVVAKWRVREGEVVERRGLRFFHPGPADPINVETWNRHGRGGDRRAVVARVAAYLRAWQAAREQQVLGAAPASSAAPQPTSARSPSARLYTLSDAFRKLRSAGYSTLTYGAFKKWPANARKHKPSSELRRRVVATYVEEAKAFDADRFDEVCARVREQVAEEATRSRSSAAEAGRVLAHEERW